MGILPPPNYPRVVMQPPKNILHYISVTADVMNLEGQYHTVPTHARDMSGWRMSFRRTIFVVQTKILYYHYAQSFFLAPKMATIINIWYYTRYLRYGTIPDTFLHGILIPIYKKGKDPEAASSYRPVNLSVVMTKILELYILEVCQTHTPHPAQFGFVDGRGTDMAISLAHDVMAYFNDRGSAVYTCSLDAEGAFDAIPHAVIFGKLDGIVPDYAWRVMYAWYRQMYVTIIVHGPEATFSEIGTTRRDKGSYVFFDRSMYVDDEMR